MDARSTSPSLASMVTAARRASSELSEPSRSEAEKTRNRMGSRCCASGMAASLIGWCPRRRDLDADPIAARAVLENLRTDGAKPGPKEREEYPEGHVGRRCSPPDRGCIARAGGGA